MKPGTRVKTPNGSGVVTGKETYRKFIRYLVEIKGVVLAFWSHEIEKCK